MVLSTPIGYEHTDSDQKYTFDQGNTVTINLSATEFEDNEGDIGAGLPPAPVN